MEIGEGFLYDQNGKNLFEKVHISDEDMNALLLDSIYATLSRTRECSFTVSTMMSNEDNVVAESPYKEVVENEGT